MQQQPLPYLRVGKLGGPLRKGRGAGDRPQTLLQIGEVGAAHQGIAVRLQLRLAVADHPLACVARGIRPDPGHRHLQRSDQQVAHSGQGRQAPPQHQPLAQRLIPRLQHAGQVKQHQTDQDPAAIGNQIGQHPQLPLPVGQPQRKQGQHHGRHPTDQEGGGSPAGQMGQAAGLGRGDGDKIGCIRGCGAEFWLRFATDSGWGRTFGGAHQVQEARLVKSGGGSSLDGASSGRAQPWPIRSIYRQCGTTAAPWGCRIVCWGQVPGLKPGPPWSDRFGNLAAGWRGPDATLG